MRRFTTLFVALCAASAIASAQNGVLNSLTLTQGQYRLTLTAPTLSSNVSATILSTATGWTLGGNALVGAGPSANLIGTTDAVDVQLIAGGTSNVRLVAESGAAAITLPTQTALRLADDAGGEYVGLRAPTGVTTYTVTLPATAPAANQVLRANSVTPTNLEWATVGGGSGWAQGGNAVTGAGNDNVLGTTTAFPLRLAAGAVTNVRLEVLDAVNAVQLPTQTALRLGDAAGGEFVGLRAPTTVGTSYTVDLPAAAPTTGQVLRATSATATEWATPASGGSAPTLTIKATATTRPAATPGYTSGILAAVSASRTYLFVITLSFQTGANGGDPRFRIVIPAGASIEYGYVASAVAFPGGTIPRGYSTAANTDHDIDINTGYASVTITGTITTGVTAGNLDVEFANQGATNTVTMHSGSTIVLTQL